MLISQCLEYRILPIPFYIFTLSGVWCPGDWKPLTKILYRFYTVILVIASILFWFTLFINLVVTRDESEFFYENIFAISTLTQAMYKEFFVLRRRKEIVDLLKTCFEDEWYTPQDTQEIQVIQEYEYEARFSKRLILFIISILTNPQRTSKFNCHD